eukprot:7019880-Alexandrium_andersonii.AAC.1
MTAKPAATRGGHYRAAISLHRGHYRGLLLPVLGCAALSRFAADSRNSRLQRSAAASWASPFSEFSADLQRGVGVPAFN